MTVAPAEIFPQIFSVFSERHVHVRYALARPSVVYSLGSWVALSDPFPALGEINRSRRNFARKRVPWVCYSTPNLAVIGKRGSLEELPIISKFAQNCGGFWPPEADKMNTFR